MRVFGFYRDDADAVDLSISSLFPEPREILLFGGGFLKVRRVGGQIFGFKGFALLYSDYSEGENGITLILNSPLFITDFGFFSDDPSALTAVGVPLDYEACKVYILEGDRDGFSPLMRTKRVGGGVELSFSGEGLRVEVRGKGRLEEKGNASPRRYAALPKIFGKLWRLKVFLLPEEAKRRARTVEIWESGLYGIHP